MSKIIQGLMLAGVLHAAVICICGCQGSKNNPPTIPENPSQDLTITFQRETPAHENFHYLWGYYLVKIDPEKFVSEIIPVREVSMHVNILKFLEQGPCTNCFKIAGISPGPSGTFNIDISIVHPFATPLLTGFDVRGIAMFNGSKVFPVSGLRMSDNALGDGELMNADGYTTLYNLLTIDHGPLEGYLKGKYATVTNATLNGFKRFITNNPGNTRNAFYAGDKITATYNIKLPSPLIFGYAIDANWAPAKNKPVTDPMADFGPEANCPEPWKIEITDIGPGLTESGGSTELQIKVYDRGGKDSHDEPVAECPELFENCIVGSFESESPDYSSWQVTIANTELVIAGDYGCLISVCDKENDPVGKPWMDLSAYQIFSVHVAEFQNEIPVALAKAEPNPQYAEEPVNFSDDGSYDPDGGSIMTYEWDWDNDGTFDEEGDNVNHTWTDPGTYYVQFRVTDNEGTSDTLDTPLEIVVMHANEPPVALAKAEPNPQIVGYLVSFSDNGSYDPDGGSIVKFEWDWDNDGIFDEEGPIKVDHTWSDPGIYYVQFRVTDDEGTSSTLDAPLEISILSGTGNLVWAKSAGGTSKDQGRGITALSDDSTVVTGSIRGTATFGSGEPNQTQLVSAGLEDIFIARYNPDGSLVWAKCAGGTNIDIGHGIAALSDDSTVVTGYFNDNATFGPGEPNQTVLFSAGQVDIFIARYNPDGSLAWAKCAGGIDNDWGYGIASLSDNSIIVSGYFAGTAVFGLGETNQTDLVSVGNADIFLACYNPDGSLVWAKRAGGTGDDVCWSVTALADNSSVMTGYFTGTATFGPGEINQTDLVSDGNPDIFIACYDPDGSLIWAKRAGGTGDDEGNGITGLPDNSTVVNGFFEGTVTFGPGETNQTQMVSAGKADVFVARYNPDGSLAWVKSAGGVEPDQGKKITPLSDNSTVISGFFWGTAIFGLGEPNQTQLVSTGFFDIFIARYGADGSLIWAKRAGGVSYDYGLEIASLSDNSTVETGYFWGTAIFGQSESNQTALVSEGDYDIFIARFMP